VPRWLNESDFAKLTSGWARAHRRHGGEGALYVYLRKRK
jgi:DNA-nicking Smr family endonuclease